MREKPKMNDMTPRAHRPHDGLGPNSDIGAKLRAYYGTVQEEPIPEKFIDLLDKLDRVEAKPSTSKAE